MDNLNLQGGANLPPKQPPPRPPQQPQRPPQPAQPLYQPPHDGEELTPAEIAKQQAGGKKVKPPRPKKEKPPKQPRQSKVKGSAVDSSGKRKIALLIILAVAVVGAAVYYGLPLILDRTPSQIPSPTAFRQKINPAAAPQTTTPTAAAPARPAGAPRTPAASPAKSPEQKNIAGTEGLPKLPEKTGQAPTAKKPAAQPPARGGATRAGAPRTALQPSAQPAPVAKKPAARTAAKPATAPKPATEKKPAAPARRTATAKPATAPKRTVATAPAQARRYVPQPAPTQKKTAKKAAAKPSDKQSRRAAGTNVDIKRRGDSFGLYSPGEFQRQGKSGGSTGDDFYYWPGGQDAGSNKSLFDSMPAMQDREKEKMLDDFTITKKLYMVLIKESESIEELRAMGRNIRLAYLSPEIKQTMSHGRRVYWLTVGHYTTAEKAYNKEQEIRALGFDTTVVSEKIHY